MTIYEEIQQQLDDREIDIRQIAAIGFNASTGHYALMEGGGRRPLSSHDYHVLDDHLEELHEAWLAECRSN